MAWQLAQELKKQELEDTKRQQPLSSLRSKVRDLPLRLPLRPRLESAIKRASENTLPHHETGQEAAPSSMGDSALSLTPGGGSLLLLPPTLSAASLPLELLVQMTTGPTSPPPAALSSRPKKQAMMWIPEFKRRPLPASRPHLTPDGPPPPRHVFEAEADVPCALVWTERFFYGGAPEDLLLSPSDCLKGDGATSGLIRADIILEPYQILESVLLRAEGILLIAEALSRLQLEDLHGWALELKLLPLLYVTNRQELELALRLGATDVIIGDGDLFSSAVKATAGAGSLDSLSKMLPEAALKLSLGGVDTYLEAERRATLGANGVVVGRGWERIRREREESE